MATFTGNRLFGGLQKMSMADKKKIKIKVSKK